MGVVLSLSPRKLTSALPRHPTEARLPARSSCGSPTPREAFHRPEELVTERAAPTRLIHSSRRSRFFVKTVGTHTPASMPRPTNQRNSRLYSSCSHNIPIAKGLATDSKLKAAVRPAKQATA